MNDTTTGQFQIKPDFFSSVEECLLADKKVVNTNPRYTFFNQTHFTAGDTDQFQSYRDATNGRLNQSINLDNNRYKDMEMPVPNWEKYKNLDPLCVDNTFNYLFHKFKKGIFVKIKNGKLRVFLPFSKKNYSNDWHGKIEIDPKYGDLYGFIKYVQIAEGYNFSPKSVNRFVDSWYANNCLVRYEFPIHEGDTNIPITSDMFHVLCKERELPDIEFFVNRRDFPMLKTNETEAYNHLFNTTEMKLSSHNYNKYAPILSMVSADDFADIPIPTGEDWARVCRPMNKFFSRTCTRNYDIISIPWEQRKSIAIFRGASTGPGVTIETNPRLKLAFLSHKKPLDDDKTLLLDAGITEWNLRPRKIQNQRYLQTIDIKSLPFGLVQPILPTNQAGYKYAINVDGHVAAYRLGLEFDLGFCVLLVHSQYKLWYRHLLQPFIHYVPVKQDLSDLIEQIKWCKRNDSTCKQIAENAKKFAQTYLSKDGILDYLQRLLFELKQMNGIYLYNNLSLLDLQHQNEYTILQQTLKIYPESNKPIDELKLFPKYPRSYDLLRGVEWIVRKAINENVSVFNGENNVVFESKATEIKKIQLGGFDLIKKTCNHGDIIHEAYNAIHAINELLQYVPNFVYTFGTYKDQTGTHLLTEYISGQTFYEYINSDSFDMKDYLFILFQLALALHIAQKKCGFVHHDLAPWNCLIHKLDKPVVIEYVIDTNTVYKVHTQIIPIMIDFTRSHVIYDNIHHGVIDMFRVSTIQDILTVLNISIYEISRSSLTQQDCKDVIMLANFISNTTYRRKPFNMTGKNGLGDVRYFFGKAKKYSELVSCKKYELEQKTPMDFVKYIQTHFPYRFTVHKNDFNIYRMNYGSARQVFDYALTSTDEKRAVSYAMVFHRAENIESVSDYDTMQNLYTTIHTTKELLTDFLQSTGLNGDKYLKKYTKAISVLNKVSQGIHKQNNDNDLKPVQKSITYDEKTFLFPQRVLDLLLAHPDTTESTDVHTLHCVAKELYKHNLDDNIPKEYKVAYDKILKL